MNLPFALLSNSEEHHPQQQPQPPQETTQPYILPHPYKPGYYQCTLCYDFDRKLKYVSRRPRKRMSAKTTKEEEKARRKRKIRGQCSLRPNYPTPKSRNPNTTSERYEKTRNPAHQYSILVK